MRINHVITTDQWRAAPQIRPAPHFVVPPPRHDATSSENQLKACSRRVITFFFSTFDVRATSPSDQEQT